LPLIDCVVFNERFVHLLCHCVGYFYKSAQSPIRIKAALPPLARSAPDNLQFLKRYLIRV